jgi:hypothetical protein
MSFHPRTELLFPPRLIPDLRNLRDEKWRDLVDRVSPSDKLAFCLMMIRLNACMGCVSGSYRFMRGCELCSQQTVARYQGTDEELIAMHEQAKDDLAYSAETKTDLAGDLPAEADDNEEVEEEDWE